jgi:small conductance mechanosensitive channel
MPLILRLVVFVGFAIVIHLVVIVFRHFATLTLASQRTRRYQKLRSLGTLATSAIVFSLYFLAIGLILREFGVSLTAYLASASVVGLAIGFGSQGVVQDVVTGLTLIFSDLLDVDDLVEVGGQVGIVKAITMRFVELENALGASVYVPNRTITNIISYPRGYIRCIADITLRGDEEAREKMRSTAVTLMQSTFQQFAGILIREPSEEGIHRLQTGKEFLRLKFRIWPNRGGPIESSFVQELTAELTRIDPDYQPWMISINYEVEKQAAQPRGAWPWRSRKRPTAFLTSKES